MKTRRKLVILFATLAALWIGGEEVVAAPRAQLEAAGESSGDLPAPSGGSEDRSDRGADGEPSHSEDSTGDGSVPAVSDTSALLYLRRCSGCHTIDRGDLTGPDLLPSTRWPVNDLRVAVERMEKNVGPMTEEQINGLVGLLKSDDLEARLDEAASRRVAELAARLEPGFAPAGRQLFFGERPFENRGVACFACHSVEGRGGNMAVDLTLAHQRLGQASILSATEAPSFPLMKASYGTKPVTAQEALHIAAYLESVKSEAEGSEARGGARPESIAGLHAAAGGVVLLSLAGIALVARTRRAGVRSRLVRDSFRR